MEREGGHGSIRRDKHCGKRWKAKTFANGGFELNTQNYQNGPASVRGSIPPGSELCHSLPVYHPHVLTYYISYYVLSLIESLR